MVKNRMGTPDQVAIVKGIIKVSAISTIINKLGITPIAIDIAR